MDWMRLEVGIDAAFVEWIRPVLVDYQYDAECLEELGLKFLRRKAQALAKTKPPPCELDAVFDSIKNARATFLEEIEDARKKAIEVDETAGSKRKFEPRPDPNPTDPHEMIIYYHMESRCAKCDVIWLPHRDADVTRFFVSEIWRIVVVREREADNLIFLSDLTFIFHDSPGSGSQLGKSAEVPPPLDGISMLRASHSEEFYRQLRSYSVW
jgi:hypothetical protein